MSLQLRDDVCAQWLYAVTHIGKLVGCMVPTSLCLPFQARHEEYEEQYRTKLQQEEEAARRAAEFKVGQHCKAVQMFRLGYQPLLHGYMYSHADAPARHTAE
jgi:hypothetical protein